MIELTISAGCACSIWKVGGGLQPRLESLPIPSEFKMKLAEWQKSCDFTCWKPLYSQRKKHDAEGNNIAAGLQQAVGEKFHVIFRHWVEFDATQWRSFWREEDMLSGECKEFWLTEDWSDEIAEKVLRIFPDFGETYLWDSNGCCLGVDSVGGTDEFDERFRKWASFWNHCTSTKTFEKDVATLAAKHFDEQGLVLAAELKRVVGDKSRVIYYSTLKKGAVEMQSDGGIRDLPPGTDAEMRRYLGELVKKVGLPHESRGASHFLASQAKP